MGEGMISLLFMGLFERSGGWKPIYLTFSIPKDGHRQTDFKGVTHDGTYNLGMDGHFSSNERTLSFDGYGACKLSEGADGTWSGSWNDGRSSGNIYGTLWTIHSSTKALGIIRNCCQQLESIAAITE